MNAIGKMQSEFDFWFKEACQYDSIDIPSKDEVDEKNETLLAISRYRYTEEETSNMLTRRKMLRPEAKISQRRIELRQALQASLSSEQEDEVLRIRKELELIEASLSHSNEVEVTPKTPSSSTPRTKSASVGLDVPSVLVCTSYFVFRSFFSSLAWIWMVGIFQSVAFIWFAS